MPFHEKWSDFNSVKMYGFTESSLLHQFSPPKLVFFPAGISDSGTVLLNQNVNGCVCMYVNHNRTVAEPISKNHNRTVAERISKISGYGSGFVQEWFGPEQIIFRATTDFST